MLQLLLDEHISPMIAEQVKIESIFAGKNGVLQGTDDDFILQTLLPEKITLVTYDLATIPLLLRDMMENGQNHAELFS